jgi:hypothetical protein
MGFLFFCLAIDFLAAKRAVTHLQGLGVIALQPPAVQALQRHDHHHAHVQRLFTDAEHKQLGREAKALGLKLLVN